MPLPFAVARVADKYPHVPVSDIAHRLWYSTFVSRAHRYFYYEVPKAACTTVKTLIHSLENLPPINPFVGSHMESRREMFIHERSQFRLPSILDFDDATQEEVMRSPTYFRFTVVRNPFTRLESAWRDKIRLCAPGYEHYYLNTKGRLPNGLDLTSIISLSEFLDIVSKQDLSNCDHHWRRQSDHLFWPVFDFTRLGHLENFADVLSALSKHVGRPLELHTSNVSRDNSQSDLDENSCSRIATLYAADFESFSYNPNQRPHSRGDISPVQIPEAKYLSEVVERNIVIGTLYAMRETLSERLRVKTEQDVQVLGAQSFSDLYEQRIALVDGWLNDHEAKLLFDLAASAQNGCIVEIGSFRGRSSTALALGTLHGRRLNVYCIEPHSKFIGGNGGRFSSLDRGHFMRNMLESGLFHVINLINLPSETVAPVWRQPVAILFLDGDHSYEAVKRDFHLWCSWLSPDADIVFGDAGDAKSGPNRLLKELLHEGKLTHVASAGRLAHLKWAV